MATSVLNRFLSVFRSNDIEEEEGSIAKEINADASKLGIYNSTIASISRTYRSGVGSQRYNFQSKTGDSEYDKLLEFYVGKFSEVGNIEIRNQRHRGDIERAIVDAYAVKHGGIIIRHHFDEKFECGYKMELIPLYMVNTTKIGIGSGDDDNWVNGFKVNRYGAVTHVALLKSTNSGILESSDVPISELTIAINQWADIIQYSGISPTLVIKETLEYIDDYKVKEMKGAGVRSETPLVLQTPWFTEAWEHMKAKLQAIDEETCPATSRSKYVPSDPAIDALNEAFTNRRLTNKKAMDNRFVYIADDENIIETGKGVFTIYPEMYENESKLASSAVGLTASSTVGAHESSYNATLKGSQGEEREFELIFEDVDELVWKPVYKNLIKGLFLKGLLTAKDYHRNPSKYFNIELLRKIRGHIDISKTAKAITERLNNGTTNVPRELRKEGIDPETFIDEAIAFEKMRIKKYEDAKIPMPQHIESVILPEDIKTEEDS